MIPDSDSVAKFCYIFFYTLPRKAKPKNSTEWTVLSCILKTQDDGKLEMISMGTGSKCIGLDKMTHFGDVLNDSHAEVMARRGFLRYLYEQAFKAYINHESIFVRSDRDKLTVKDDVQFHFFSSHTPCGDISNIINEDALSMSSSADCNKEQVLNYEVIKRRKLDDGTFINITGAKALVMKACGEEDIGLGQPCLKPGRGSPTLSMSCSDKLARWLHVGIQGALLSILIEEPITFHSITIGGGCKFSKGSFYRGLVDRNFADKYENQWEELLVHNDGRLPVVPVIQQSTIEFMYNKSADTVPCPTSMVWCSVEDDPLQVAVNGKKLGTTMRNWNSLSTSLMISKYVLFDTFMSIASHLPVVKNISEDPTYRSVKRISVDYYRRWDEVKKNFFGVWTIKPDVQNFKITADWRRSGNYAI